MTAGLSEAVRPMLGGGNRNLLDNYGAVSIGGPFSKPAQDFFNPKQPAQKTSFTQQPFQNPYDSVGQVQRNNQTIR